MSRCRSDLHAKINDYHPEESSSDSDICGRYQRFLTSFYNGVYGEIRGLTKISDNRFMGGLCTEIVINNYG